MIASRLRIQLADMIMDDLPDVGVRCEPAAGQPA